MTGGIPNGIRGLRSLVGERANPHPSQAEKWIVEVVDEDFGGDEVCVQYLHPGPHADSDPWWITKQAWADWKKHTV